MRNSEKCYVLQWSYSDKSGFGIVNVFMNIEDAKEQCDLLSNHCDGVRDFSVIEVNLLEDK